MNTYVFHVNAAASAHFTGDGPAANQSAFFLSATLAHSGPRLAVNVGRNAFFFPRIPYQGETVPGFSSIACAYVLRFGDVSGNSQRLYFGEPALRELNLSKLRPIHFLTP